MKKKNGASQYEESQPFDLLGNLGTVEVLCACLCLHIFFLYLITSIPAVSISSSIPSLSISHFFPSLFPFFSPFSIYHFPPSFPHSLDTIFIPNFHLPHISPLSPLPSPLSPPPLPSLTSFYPPSSPSLHSISIPLTHFLALQSIQMIQCKLLKIFSTSLS